MKPADAVSAGSVPPLIKWTGGKRSQAARLAALAPPHTRYFEPFLGGGAVLWHLARPGAVAGDLYAPLVDLWTLVAREPDQVIEAYRERWDALRADLPGFFYVVRARFNARPNPHDLNFLLRTCVNGIVRFNASGEFNNSYHLSRPGMHPDRVAGVVRRWSARLDGVGLVCGDFEETLSGAQAGDFAYLDPPYRGTRQRYRAGPEPERLFTVLERLNVAGVRWALSYDGRRGAHAYDATVPEGLHRRKLVLGSGLSAVAKVLNDALEPVEEAVYLNY